MIELRTSYDAEKGFGFEWDSKPEGMTEEEYWAVIDSSLSVAMVTLYTARAAGSKGLTKLYVNRLAESVRRIIEDDALDTAQIGVKHD